MNVLAYIQDQQPIVYQTFFQALKKNRLSHAYMLVGEEGMPLKEIALFLAQSMVCLHPKPFADLVCNHCVRIQANNFADLHILDGEQALIKKEDVLNLESTLSMTALETSGKLIYIIHLIEHITPEAIQSLLKFLEEPNIEIYAILTTENVDQVLPTILSRSQLIALKATDQNLVINEAIKLQVDIEDAQLLSFFYVDAHRLKDVARDEVYQAIKTLVKDYVEILPLDLEKAGFLLRSQSLEQMTNQDDLKKWIDFYVHFIQEAIHVQLNKETILTSYGKIIENLSRHAKRLESHLKYVLELRHLIDMNVLPALILERIHQSFLGE